MFNDILKAILNSMIMVSSFCIFMFCCLLSNTILGASIAYKKEAFDWKLLLRGLLKNIGIMLGINILSVGISGTTKLIEIYGIALEYSEIIEQVSLLAIVVTIITLSYRVYGAQAIEKIQSLGNFKKDDIVKIKADSTQTENFGTAGSNYN